MIPRPVCFRRDGEGPGESDDYDFGHQEGTCGIACFFCRVEN